MKYVAVCLFSGILSLSACETQYSIGIEEPAAKETPTNEPSIVVPPKKQVKCDPLDHKTGASTGNIIAQLYSAGGRLHDNTVDEFFTTDETGKQIYAVDTTLYFSDLDVPLRAFTEGFTGIDGSPLMEPGTQIVLDEWFAIHAKSRLKLSDTDQPGYYQMVLVSDDGANFYVNGDTTPLVDNDGVHSVRIACADRAIKLDRDSRIPFVLDYYQGPANEIALQVKWRRLDSAVIPTDCHINDTSFLSLSNSNYEAAPEDQVQCVN